MKIRVADYIADYLEKRGVRKVFLLAGGGMMHLIDAVGRRTRLGYVCNHHEHAGALAAEGYARETGQLGVCYATSGPGASNTVTGVVECWQDSVPVLFVSGQSKLSQTIQGSKIYGLRQFGTFEVDIISIVKPITKYAAFLDDPAQIRFHLEKACALATSGRPGPVFIDVPVDVQGALIDPEKLVGYREASEAPNQPADSVMDEVVDRLAAARRPLILAGHGIRAAGAVEKFRELSARLNVPVATTQLAADLLPYDHPLYVGHPGMKGDRPGNLAVQCADVILSLGSSLHVLTTGYELDRFAPTAYKIQVELDENVLKREQVGVQKKIACGIPEFLDCLERRLANRSTPNKTLVASGAWHERCLLWKRELSVRKEPHARPNGAINYYDLNDALSDLCADTDTVVTDAGSAFYVIGQAFRTKKGQRVIISGALGAMGHALPLALGAAAAAPEKKIVCVTGDGSFQTNIQELATIAHHKFNIAIFVVNNDGYVSIRNTQKNFFGGFLVGTDPKSGVTMPDLEKIASAYGIPYRVARDLNSLTDTVREALCESGPVLCEVFTAPIQEIIPTVSSFKRPDGTMESKPLHDMYPFLDPALLEKYMMKDESAISAND
jgi:acetolactate synthase-1/2/3 large subunit